MPSSLVPASPQGCSSPWIHTGAHPPSEPFLTLQLNKTFLLLTNPFPKLATDTKKGQAWGLEKGPLSTITLTGALSPQLAERKLRLAWVWDILLGGP